MTYIPTLSGNYTPTLTGITNIAGSTSQNAIYTRIGNIVTVFGSCYVNTTLGASTSSIIDISLPIASNLGVIQDLNGLGQGPLAFLNSVMISGNTTNDRGRIEFTSVGTASVTIFYSFSYSVI